MAFLGQGPSHKLNQMNGNNRDMPTAKNRDSPLALVLQECEFLGQGVDPIKGRKIQ